MDIQKTEAEKIIELLISEGKFTQEELDTMVELEREKSPLLPIQQNVEDLRETNDTIIIGLVDTFENQMISDMAREEETAVGLTATMELFEMVMMLEMRIQELEGGK